MLLNDGEGFDEVIGDDDVQSVAVVEHQHDIFGQYLLGFARLLDD